MAADDSGIGDLRSVCLCLFFFFFVAFCLLACMVDFLRLLYSIAQARLKLIM